MGLSTGNHAGMDFNYEDLLEIDTFRVVRDKDFSTDPHSDNNNFTQHWIAHICAEYLADEDPDTEPTGAFDSDEIKNGACAYCERLIPEGIIALWSLLEWEDAGHVLHAKEIWGAP